VTFIEAPLREGLDAPLRKSATDTTAAIERVHCEVLQVAPAAVGAAQYGSDDMTVIYRDEAKPAVRTQVAGDGFALVDIAQNKPFRDLPESNDLVVVGGLELAQLYHEKRLVIRITPPLNCRRRS
jgi:hypothetical protein